MLHLVGCLCYLYQWCTVKQISDNEIYVLIKYIKRKSASPVLNVLKVWDHFETSQVFNTLFCCAFYMSTRIILHFVLRCFCTRISTWLFSYTSSSSSSACLGQDLFASSIKLYPLKTLRTLGPQTQSLYIRNISVFEGRLLFIYYYAHM